VSDPAVDSFLVLSAARLAPRTIEAYRRDLADLTAFLGGSPADATTERLQAYVARMRADGLAASTIARRIAAIRSFFHHEVLIGVRKENPAAELELPRRRRALPKTLSPGEVERLIEAATGVTPRALRDQALVELLYGAGLRVGEAVGLDKAGVDLENRFVRALGKGSKERIVPLGRPAVDALNRYLSRGRPYLDKRHRSELFLNAQGGPLTRAGAFLCHTSARRRRRPPVGSRDARPRRSRDDRALYPRIRSAAARVVLSSAPPRSEEVDEEVGDVQPSCLDVRRGHAGGRLADGVRGPLEERARAEAAPPGVPVLRPADHVARLL
jgi:site-specific recombinase XerD